MRYAEINIWDVEKQLLVAYAVGNTSYTTSIDNHYTIDEGYTGWITRHKEPLFITNIENFSATKPKLSSEKFPFRSYIGLPLTVNQTFLGTLELAHSKQNKYTQEDLDSLQVLAGQAAVAIRHAQIFQESQKHIHIQEQLASIASLANATLNLDELLSRIMAKTVEALGAQMGSVLLLNKDETALFPHPASIVGIDSKKIEQFNFSVDAPQFQKSIFSTGQPFLSNNARTDERVLPIYHNFISEFNIETVLGVSLITADKNIGEIYIFNKPTSFTHGDITFLSSIAVHFAAAIQNATLFEATQRNLSELSILYQSTADLSSSLSVEEVLTNLANRMVSILPADECVISRYNQTTSQVEVINKHLLPGGAVDLPQAYSSSENHLTKEVLLSHTPVVIHVNDAQANIEKRQLLRGRKQSVLLMLPLVVRNQSVGLIELYTRNDVDYHSKEIVLAQAMASQAAIALQNAQLYKEIDQQLTLRLRELSGLQKVGRELNSTLDLNTIIRLVLEEAVRATDADFGNVDIYHQETKTLQTQAQVGWPKEAMEVLLTKTDKIGIMGRSIRNNVSEIVDDVSSDPDYFPFSTLTRSKMVVPIQYGDIAEGGINLESTRLAGFTQTQLHYVQALADQSAIAIRNAQAFESQMKERREAAQRVSQLARLSEINRAFRANRPLEFYIRRYCFCNSRNCRV